MGLLDFFKKGTPQPAANNNQNNNAQTTNTTNAGTQNTAAQADTYTVKSGDSLSKIAKNFYGDPMQWKKIYEANKDVIGSNPDMIQPGQTYKIPRG